MGLLQPIYGLINFIVGCSISTLEYFEAVVEPSIIYIEKDAPSSERKSPDSDVPNAECPPPSTPPKEIKRIKLLLDIMISPGGSRVVNVSSKHVMDIPQPSMRERLFSRLAILLLTLTQIIKRVLLYSNYKFTGALDNQPSPSTNGCRRTKSPKRRISSYKRLISRYPFRIIGLPGNSHSEECALSMPEGYESDKANTSLNTSRTQIVEKRKRPEDDGSLPSSEACYSSDEDTVLTKTPVVTPEKGVDEVSDSPTDENFEESQEYSSDSYQPSSSLMQRLVDITEEEYESAEDPDYQAPQDHFSSSSSSEDEGPRISDSDIETELNNLLDEARQEVPNPEAQRFEPVEQQPQNEENIPENPRQVLGNGEDRQELDINDDNEEHHNEYEYTNGQASSRELTIRNNLLRRFYETESGASSPFSVNPSEPSVPNTPRSLGSDSSQMETP